MPTASRYRSNGSGAKPAATKMKASKTAVKTVNLALQGGGAHGAFAWGVLDRLLEDERISFEGISACSAGAMNAVVLADGLTEGGRDGAKIALANFWRRISRSTMFSPLQPTPWDRITHNHAVESSPAFMAFDLMTRMLSPYEFNPFNFNPLRDVIRESVDFDRIQAGCAAKLFLSATNVCSGKVKIFSNPEISIDAVLASACLPFMFQAVEIGGEHYWDGGYMGNPAIYPLIYNCDSSDIVVVHINPISRDTVPRNARDIMNRINEISFNSSLMREMRAIAFVTKMIDENQVCDGGLKRMNIHAIAAETFMRDLSVSSKLNPDWEFLTHLRDVGREQAEAWLAGSFEKVNHESSIDLRETYL
ncbi:MAG: patatin-like phospholipase family protein [Kiloniellaceae bacterium]